MYLHPFRINALDIYAAGKIGFKDTCGVDQETGEFICAGLPTYTSSTDSRYFYPGETTTHSDGILDFVGGIHVTPSQITTGTIVNVKIVAYRTDAYINYIRQVYIKGSDGRRWILATGEKGTHEVQFQIPDTIPIGEYGIDLDLVVENYIGGTYTQNLQTGYSVSACTPTSPSTTPLAVEDGILSLPPYKEPYKPVRIYLIGKDEDTNSINPDDSIDYEYCGYDLEAEGCRMGPDRNYLLLGLNDYSGEAGGTHRANHVLLIIDNTVIPVNIPEFTFSGQARQRIYFYVAEDGSLYHANTAKNPITAEHHYQSINLSPSQALVPGNRASTCLNDVPLPPIGEFKATKGITGGPAVIYNKKIFINSQLQTNKEILLFTYSNNPAVPAAWTKTSTDSNGILLLSNLYNYSNYGYYYLVYPLFSYDSSSIFFDPDNRFNSSYAPPSRSTESIYFDGTPRSKDDVPIPPEGVASVSGSLYALIGGGSAPLRKIPLYVIDVDDTEQIFSLRTDQNGLYELRNIPSGRYLFVTQYWTGPSLYAPKLTDIYKPISPGENTINIILK